MDIEAIIQKIPECEDRIIKMHEDLCMFSSWDPKFGEVVIEVDENKNPVNKRKGDGGMEKVGYIRKALADLKFFDKIEDHHSQDSNGNPVPILLAKKNGQNADGPTLWITMHVDTIAPNVTEPGYKPLEAIVTKKDEVKAIEGLGTEDNNQAIVEAYITAAILAKNNITLKNNLGYLFMGREELGSSDGGAVDFLKKMNPEHNLIRSGDIVIVPDSPSPTGADVVVQEGHIQEIHVRYYRHAAGKKDDGVGIHVLFSQARGYENPVVAAAELVTYAALELEDKRGFEWIAKEADNAEMYTGYPGQLSRTTINPTTTYNNNISTNNISGECKITFDNRYIAEDSQNPDAVFEAIKNKAEKIAESYHVKVEVTKGKESPYYGSTQKTDAAYRLIEKVLSEMGIKMNPMAIKAGTFGRFFHIAGATAIACGSGDGTEHNPGEYTKIPNNYLGIERNLRCIATDLTTLIFE